MRQDRLSEWDFTDLYLSRDGDRRPTVRGMRRWGESGAGHGGIHFLPEGFGRDIEVLHAIVVQEAKSGDREFSIEHDGQYYRCSMIAAPDNIEGGDWCLRRTRPAPPPLTGAEMTSAMLREVNSCAEEPGLVLVSGAFASGKTTLAASIFDHWVRESRDVGVAFEDPPEIPMARTDPEQGVVYQFDVRAGNLERAMEYARRWSPRYLFLGEIRTGQAARQLLHMSLSGVTAICTIHAADPVRAITSLYRFASDAMEEGHARDMISSSLLKVFHRNSTVRFSLPEIADIRHPSDTHLVRTKIAEGNFRTLREQFDTQAVNREKSESLAGRLPRHPGAGMVS